MKLSIVTINLNNYQGLKKTLESINSLDLTGIEFIVIDGASTDGSVELIQSYSKIITHALIEKDSGIYNAMNKGVQLAKGDYLYFLNSGDVLLSSFPQIINSLDNTSSYAFSVLSERNNQIKPFNPNDFGYVKYYDFAFPHQGFIFKKEVFDRFGYYDESYKMLADFKLILQILYNELPLVINPSINLALYDLSGFSSDMKNRGLMHLEKQRAFKEVSPGIYSDLIILLDYRQKWDKLRSILKKYRIFWLYKLLGFE